MSTTFQDEETEQRIIRAAGSCSSEAAEWLKKLRATAWKRFEATPSPTRADENWRFATLQGILPEEVTVCEIAGEEEAADWVARSVGEARAAGKMIFGNERLLLQEAYEGDLKERGVIWLPLLEAARQYPDLVQSHLMRDAAGLGSAKYAALHLSQLRAGTFLYVPRGVELALPLETFHWLGAAGGACFPHTLIIAEEGSRVTMMDYFQSSERNGAGWACGVNDIIVGAGASVTYVSVQDWGRRVTGFQLGTSVVGRDGRSLSLQVHLGGSRMRSESVSRLRGEGGRSDMLSVSVADGDQEYDQRTLQVHEVANTSSDLLYKNALDDAARTIFAGLIRVEPGAHRTDAYQKVRNLLLSGEAEANSAPGLEIEADDVRCSHGATTGEVDADQLFYLLSRGIPRHEACKLIVHGFLEEVLERLGRPELTGYLGGRVYAKFDSKASSAR
jgi:Fe-S cluster assembly protein SufD